MSKLTLSFKGLVLHNYPLPHKGVVIGSSPECDIHIDSLAVHARHARVYPEADGWSVEDLGSPEGTFVNNTKITGAQPLKDGDIIRVGKHTLAYEFGPALNPAAEPLAAEPLAEDELSLQPTSAPKTAWLQIMTGHNLGKTISLNRKMTNLGKPGVQTAVIARRNDGFFISHLEGEHTPSVGGVAIGDRSWQLNDGDEIQIGNVKMQFYLQ